METRAWKQLKRLHEDARKQNKYSEEKFRAVKTSSHYQEIHQI